MPLEGLHHVTAICADAPRNVDFYARVLGLRLVKKTVNFDQPDVYHLYYGDEAGTPGSILTFFEFPGAAPGVAGAGMVHAIVWRTAGPEALAFWATRLADEGAPVTWVEGGVLRFTDPEGLVHELVASDAGDPPLTAVALDVPPEHRLLGFHGVRAYSAAPEHSAPVLRALGFTRRAEGGAWVAEGERRHGVIHYDRPPPARHGMAGAGTVHHVAWSAADDAELTALRGVVRDAGGHPTPIIDRQYFHSVYFREPSGVLFELATRDIGFAVDEDARELGRDLKLPPRYESRRAQLETLLTPLANPRY
ncbi:MAG TPA: VOC family protein [Baekduia sp.]|uniref:VOC family protein n=1 Tax=Baekduia sp. TaxID=2600305 RepID=UPI002D775F1D|nr:VOC family protein [Baekduia sp.]HET6507565.1 VOC family protein [Baekduia sp.]